MALPQPNNSVTDQWLSLIFQALGGASGMIILSDGTVDFISGIVQKWAETANVEIKIGAGLIQITNAVTNQRIDITENRVRVINVTATVEANVTANAISVEDTSIPSIVTLNSDGSIRQKTTTFGDNLHFLGAVQNGATVVDNTKYLEISINGLPYKIALAV